MVVVWWWWRWWWWWCGGGDGGGVVTWWWCGGGGGGGAAAAAAAAACILVCVCACVCACVRVCVWVCLSVKLCLLKLCLALRWSVCFVCVALSQAVCYQPSAVQWSLPVVCSVLPRRQCTQSCHAHCTHWQDTERWRKWYVCLRLSTLWRIDYNSLRSLPHTEYHYLRRRGYVFTAVRLILSVSRMSCKVMYGKLLGQERIGWLVSGSHCALSIWIVFWLVVEMRALLCEVTDGGRK